MWFPHIPKYTYVYRDWFGVLGIMYSQVVVSGCKQITISSEDNLSSTVQDAVVEFQDIISTTLLCLRKTRVLISTNRYAKWHLHLWCTINQRRHLRWCAQAMMIFLHEHANKYLETFLRIIFRQDYTSQSNFQFKPSVRYFLHIHYTSRVKLLWFMHIQTMVEKK